MISILRPSTPPWALISSAAIWAACGIDAPAMACASAMTPILIGSAAKAGPAAANRPRVVAPRRVRKDQETGGCNVFVISFLSRCTAYYCLSSILTVRGHAARETAPQIPPRWPTKVGFGPNRGSNKALGPAGPHRDRPAAQSLVSVFLGRLFRELSGTSFPRPE